mmetsp:Transcript_29188/g.63475  ORF Transcript_29188/g.63475 Transcript_29188/m.63475 type:complete len:233 (-) Transcript_29188:7-705(-)
MFLRISSAYRLALMVEFVFLLEKHIVDLLPDSVTDIPILELSKQSLTTQAIVSRVLLRCTMTDLVPAFRSTFTNSGFSRSPGLALKRIRFWMREASSMPTRIAFANVLAPLPSYHGFLSGFFSLTISPFIVGYSGTPIASKSHQDIRLTADEPVHPLATIIIGPSSDLEVEVISEAFSCSSDKAESSEGQEDAATVVNSHATVTRTSPVELGIDKRVELDLGFPSNKTRAGA